MSNVTHLKFFTVDEFPMVTDHCRRGWKFRRVGHGRDGVELCAVYIKDGEERECHVLRCPECITSEVEVYHLNWSMLTCPICNLDVALEDWINEEEFLDLCEAAYDTGLEDEEDEPA